jgi:PKD repeat protein
MCVFLLTGVLIWGVTTNTKGQVTLEWVARYDNTTGDTAYALAIDNSMGNIYVTGRSGTVSYDPSGNKLWRGQGNGWEVAVAQSSGNVYVTGNDGTRAFDRNGNLLWEDLGHEGRDLTIDQLFEIIFVTGYCDVGGQGEDFITIAYDSLGNQLWQAFYNGPVNGNDGGKAIAIDPFGKIIVAGTSEGPDTPSGNHQEDYVTITYDSYGNQHWLTRYDGPGNMDDHLRAMAVDSLGNIYVTGKSGISYYGDFTTIAYDNSGNPIWIDRISGPRSDSQDSGQDIVIDTSDNIFITGIIEKGISNWDYYTIRYNTSGSKLWTASYNGPIDRIDQAHRMALDLRGNIYVAGYSYGAANNADYATISYDSNGNQLWVARYVGPGNGSDIAYGLGVDSSGNVYVTGRSYNGIRGNDYITIKYSQEFSNQPPVADAGPDKIVYIGEVVQFDGSASYDPDGTIVSYEWDFGDGSLQSTAANPTHIYYLSGIYTVSLTVTDDNNEEDSDSCTITVIPLEATIDIDPDTLNLKSKGKWITCYIDLPGYDVKEIDISSILLEDVIPAEWGDIQNTRLMVKFERSEVEDLIGTPSEDVELIVTGELKNGIHFEGSDIIRVIDPGK